MMGLPVEDDGLVEGGDEAHREVSLAPPALRRAAPRGSAYFRPINILFILTFFAFGLSPGASAQNVTVDGVPDAQRRLQEDLERTDSTAFRARIESLLQSGGDVAYTDVLRDPDNIDLNFRFAQTQIRQGNIRGASATLERILLLDPTRPDVRLLYAVVLFRLDNLTDAERELRAVRDLPMKPELRSEVDSLLDQIDQRRRRLRAELLVNMGIQYDWNGNSAQYSNTRLFSDTPVSLSRTPTSATVNSRPTAPSRCPPTTISD